MKGGPCGGQMKGGHGGPPLQIRTGCAAGKQTPAQIQCPPPTIDTQFGNRSWRSPFNGKFELSNSVR